MPKRLFWSAWAGIAFFVVSACIFTMHFLQYRFGGYDLSPLIDSGWRVLQGQAPNRDFLCTFPPILYVGVALAFRILGVRWFALSLASALYSFTLTMLGMRILLLLRRRLGEAPVLHLSLVFAILQMLPYLAIGHPWHSSWTEAADIYAFAATFALLEIGSASKRDCVELLAHLCLAESLILLAKPNTGLPALAFCTLALLLRKAPEQRPPSPSARLSSSPPSSCSASIPPSSGKRRCTPNSAPDSFQRATSRPSSFIAIHTSECFG